jgi:TPR repeat protein
MPRLPRQAGVRQGKRRPAKRNHRALLDFGRVISVINGRHRAMPLDRPALRYRQKRNVMRNIIAVALAVMLAMPVNAQDFDKGLDAFERGDYAAALQEWRPLAEQGSPRAQYRLGVMYAYGILVTKDYKKAHEWYEKAARQGNAQAAYELGLMYEIGRGVVEDRHMAAYWYQQGALRGHGPSQEKFSRFQRYLR